MATALAGGVAEGTARMQRQCDEQQQQQLLQQQVKHHRHREEDTWGRGMECMKREERGRGMRCTAEQRKRS